MVGAQPLAGTRVLDLTRFVSGSYATMLLAGLGAEVVKIEVPPDGDPYRAQGAGSVGGHAAIFLALNNGKRSVALDFRADEARPAIRALIDSADFFVENARPGSLARHDLDYDSLHADHPALIYGSISGYGQHGPDATRGGFDLILQAESGIMSVTGTPDSGPVKVGAPVLDVGAGVSCVAGLLAAHIQRQATGVGVHVSSSLFEFAFSSLTTLIADWDATGDVPARLGSHSPTFAPYGVFETADDPIAIAGTGSEHLWPALCEVLASPELVDDRRYATNSDRVHNRDQLTADIEDVLTTAAAGVWLERLEDAGVPAGRVRDVAQTADSSQTKALGLLQESRIGDDTYRAVAPPLRLGEDPTPFPGGAAELGADTRAVLESVGLTDGEVDELVASGVAMEGG